jgi:hypothetical protein
LTPRKKAQRTARSGVVELRLMSAFENAQEILHEADHVGRRRQQLQVIGLERRLLISAHERHARVLPRPGGIGRTPLLEGIACQLSHCEERYSSVAPAHAGRATDEMLPTDRSID